MACSISTVKCLIFCFTTLLGIFGLVLLGFGALFALFEIGIFFDETSSLEELTVYELSIALLVIGFLLFIIAIVGCYAVGLNSHCMVVTFVVLLSIILIAEVVIVIIAAISKGEVDKTFEKKVEAMFLNGDFKELDEFQKAMECCGLDGPNYWQSEQHFMLNPPSSCCKEPCTYWGETEKLYPGCKEELKEMLDMGGLTLLLLIIVLGIIEIIDIILAGWLASTVKNQHRGQIYAPPGYH